MPTPDEIGIDSAFFTGPRLRKNHPSAKYRASDVSEDDVRTDAIPREEQERCGTCAFWRYGLCQLVEGSIDSFFTCNFWERPVRTFREREGAREGATMPTATKTTAATVKGLIQREGESLVQSGKAASLAIAINMYIETPAGQAMSALLRKLLDFPYDAMLAGRGEQMLATREFSELPPAPMPVSGSEADNVPLRFLHKVADELREADPTLTPVDALELAAQENPDVVELHSERMRAVSLGLCPPDVSGFGAALDKGGVTPFQLISMKAEELLDEGTCANLNEAIEEVCRRRPELREAHSRAMRM